MTTKHQKYLYRASASKLHRAIGDILRSHPTTRSLRFFQEYPIPHTPYHVDWFILELKMAIECHGEQHDHPVAFDGDKDKAEEAFKNQKIRDIKKKRLCEEQGWNFIEIWFNEDLDADKIIEKILSKLRS
jgi:very-short-patch-repair endonuclease